MIRTAPAARREETRDGYYRAEGAAAIMSVAHFPDEVLTFLQMECLTAFRATRRRRCDAIAELGCFDGRALEVARAAGIRYLGIDVNQDAITALRARIAAEGLDGSATALTADVQDSEDWLAAIPGQRPLVVLPFNLLGNFTEPERVLARLRTLPGAALISVFNAEPSTTALRHAYYTRCGTALEQTEGRFGGVLFRSSQGFRSESFNRAGLDRLLKQCGLRIAAETSNRLGRCLTVHADDTVHADVTVPADQDSQHRRETTP
ncbi:hypothetical protein [Kitasatospora sp. McL0602]|uniref:hypothetical protein n=1 Tax=Kitasatospora sp. McL0602 TaxID=3439530 RepID=UPI003F8CA2E4